MKDFLKKTAALFRKTWVWSLCLVLVLALLVIACDMGKTVAACLLGSFFFRCQDTSRTGIVYTPFVHSVIDDSDTLQSFKLFRLINLIMPHNGAGSLVAHAGATLVLWISEILINQRNLLISFNGMARIKETVNIFQSQS